MLTKKRMALITVLLAVLFFILLLSLPEAVVGSRAENMLLFAPKLLFLSVTAAITMAFILILIFKRDFIKWQAFSFSRYKYYLWQLVKAEYLKRYRKSVLGVLWSLLNPLLTMLVMTMVFSLLFRFQIPNYPLYILSGRVIFGFFEEAAGHSMHSVIGAEAVIKKVYVPKYVYPVSQVLSSLVNILFFLLAFLAVFVITRAPFHWTVLLIPIPIIYTFVFTLGLGMLLSSMAVFFRDIVHLYGIGIMLLTYATPLFYPVDIIPEWAMPIMGFNPIYHFLTYFRSVALDGVVPGLWPNVVCMGFALAALCCGVYVFMSQQDKYILHL